MKINIIQPKNEIGIEICEYIEDNNGITTKRITKRKYHFNKILWEKHNLWNSVNGYTKKEF